ncbi:hypothetical protein MX582_004797 [Salmonella enterica]|nr:hypothetical protein [Salmonella enterica]EKQ0934206.1 hypothetical protein [Salmonella enterica]EKQ0938922.1 hypothetical protein [Salmonella enterica]
MTGHCNRKVNFATMRECQLAILLLNKKGRFNLPMYTGNTPQELNHQINQMLDNRFRTELQKKRKDIIIICLESVVKNNIIDETQFEWLRKNETLTLCLWWVIKTNGVNIFAQNLDHLWRNKNTLNILQFKNGNILSETAAARHEERLRDIITFLDNLIVKGSKHIYTKSDLLNLIKNEYINKRQLRLSLPWLIPENQSACKWAWYYTMDYHEKYRIRYKNSPDNFENRTIKLLNDEFTSKYNPDTSSSQEYVLAVNAAFELWSAGDGTRELFITKIKRAWSQYNLRHSRKDKKPVNCFINTSTKKKLEIYCEKTNRTITEVIETLINTYCNPPF